MLNVKTKRDVNYNEYISNRFEVQKIRVKYFDDLRADVLAEIKSGNLTPKKVKDYKNRLKGIRIELRRDRQELESRKAEFLALKPKKY